VAAIYSQTYANNDPTYSSTDTYVTSVKNSSSITFSSDNPWGRTVTTNYVDRDPSTEKHKQPKFCENINEYFTERPEKGESLTLDYVQPKRELIHKNTKRLTRAPPPFIFLFLLYACLLFVPKI
jgi:hypothetical protein